MKAKFCGMLILLGMSAFIVTVNQQTTSEAGLLRRLFGGGAYASCGGGGGLQYGTYSSCGGGGLQYGVYSSCGGGGGLQYAPASYYYSTPVTYAAPYSGGASCPHCQVAPSGFTYAQPRFAPVQVATAPPVPLNPGERYVAGSLRPAQQARSYTAPEVKPAIAGNGLLPRDPDYAFVMLTQDNCGACNIAKNMLEGLGIKVEIVNIDDDPERAKEVWEGSKYKLDKTPAFAMLYKGEPVNHRTKPISGSGDLIAMANFRLDTDDKRHFAETRKREPVKVAALTPEMARLERLEVTVCEIQAEQRRQNDKIIALLEALVATSATKTASTK